MNGHVQQLHQSPTKYREEQAMSVHDGQLEYNATAGAT